MYNKTSKRFLTDKIIQIKPQGRLYTKLFKPSRIWHGLQKGAENHLQIWYR